MRLWQNEKAGTTQYIVVLFFFWHYDIGLLQCSLHGKKAHVDPVVPCPALDGTSSDEGLNNGSATINMTRFCQAVRCSCIRAVGQLVAVAVHRAGRLAVNAVVDL